MDLKQWYKETRTECKLQGPLTAERVRASGDWPKLKAKAAATRRLAEYALNLAQRFARVDSLDAFTQTHDQMSLAACQLLVEFYALIRNESQTLSAEAKARIPILGNQLASIYSKLAKMSFDKQWRLWKLLPKLHLFLHLCVEQAPMMGNPRFFWTYGDEDLVKWMIQIADGGPPRYARSVRFREVALVHFRQIAD